MTRHGPLKSVARRKDQPHIPSRRDSRRGGERLAHLGPDRRGATTIEFAFLAPILIVAYGAAITLGDAIMIQQRTAHMASAVGDLIAQQATLSAGYPTNAFSAGALIMAPFSPTYSQRVSSAVVQSNQQVQFSWSCFNGTYTTLKGQTVTPPTGIVSPTTAGDSAIYSEVTTTFNSPLTAGILPAAFTFKHSFWLKPRSGSQILAPTSC